MRKAKAKKRIVLPDPQYNDVSLTRFVNNMMFDGEKGKAFKIMYDALDTVEKKTKENGLEVWKRALTNCTPMVEVVARRVGGATFQIPTEIRPEKRMTMGMKWLIMYSRKRNGKTMADKLSAEILAAANNEGAAVKKKEDTHKMAEANKAFSHFRV
ncbi:MAG: 30S ribosomal protein S7 [Bacteroidetes bacterium]|nr:30S ribosomal protein S7 [Bacteroidota bacterium]